MQIINLNCSLSFFFLQKSIQLYLSRVPYFILVAFLLFSIGNDRQLNNITLRMISCDEKNVQKAKRKLNSFLCLLLFVVIFDNE